MFRNSGAINCVSQVQFQNETKRVITNVCIAFDIACKYFYNASGVKTNFLVYIVYLHALVTYSSIFVRARMI